ncbi:uncharacterized protein MELLADRAFT_87005 [Melampsora larici-populina 98AG31]|uniref:Secreted protein n=1 Tax=Melampsora larici-populina (strain 98AG31 / pathotype 3-4-7) TaxID=747676 RepID=F4R464_MELLP|nr:uncharacterized protein MELLADRAFT_87005 [Melampsora larici-populina 98AG31]EGG13049.1 secreted protein [Melampsora larici-populina 98AG31]
MLSFQSPHRLFAVFIAIWITQFAVTLSQTATVKCMHDFGILTPAYFAFCRDSGDTQWVCPTASCQKDGKRWVPMKNCALDHSVGTSDQQCARYNYLYPGCYQCTNPGGQKYTCSDKPQNVPYITCTECTKSNTNRA